MRASRQRTPHKQRVGTDPRAQPFAQTRRHPLLDPRETTGAAVPRATTSLTAPPRCHRYGQTTKLLGMRGAAQNGRYCGGGPDAHEHDEERRGAALTAALAAAAPTGIPPIDPAHASSTHQPRHVARPHLPSQGGHVCGRAALPESSAPRAITATACACISGAASTGAHHSIFACTLC